MRAIEFRAWHKESKKMFYLDSEQYGFNFKANGQWGYCDYVCQCVYVTHKTGVLMQFTGLLDKNGKKIFEGDIHIMRSGPTNTVHYRRIVKWKDNLTGFNIANHGAEHGEVIGNIWENPELLKKGE